MVEKARHPAVSGKADTQGGRKVMTAVELPIAVRAYAVPEKPSDRVWDGRTGWRARQFGARALIFDTETTVDTYQNLLVGSFLVLDQADPARYPGGYRPACQDPVRPCCGLI